MKTIRNGIENVAKVINKNKLSVNEKYRLSKHTYHYEDNGRYLVQSTMTKEVIELSDDEWKALKALQNEPQGFDIIEKHGLTELAVKRIIVEENYDELKQYQQTAFLLKTMLRQKKGLSGYIIFPTTGCNARCVYCYEEGYTVKTMTPEIIDRLVDFICETRHDDMITLKWFGGEPLAGANIIHKICTSLQERGVPYKSSMVTNASLMTKELAHEANELWHLKKVQVSLDGAKEDYTPRKNYYNPSKHNYDVVMKAIHYLADEGIKVNLRVNVDFDNIERIPVFLREIKTEFGDMNNITLYIAPLFQVMQSNRCIELYEKIFELNDLASELGIPHTKRSNNKQVFRLNYCMADNMDKSIVITPDGVFNNCEHVPETQTWGNIFDGVTNQTRFDELRKPATIDKKCAGCAFLPMCTPFYKNGCSGWFEKCNEYRCLSTEHSLHNLLKGDNTETEDDDEEL